MQKKLPSKPLSRNQQVQKLKLFNEKIDLIRRGRFAALVSRPDHGFTLSLAAGAPMTVEKRGADEESTLALVTTLRFFVQERDGVTIAQIADLYDALPVEELAKTSAREAANANEEYLSRPCGVGLNGTNYTNREIFDIFMYGGLAHANEEKRPKYKTLMGSPAAPMMQFLFEDTAVSALLTASQTTALTSLL
jgi:hypothetical protein